MNRKDNNWQLLQGWLRDDSERMRALELAAGLALPQWCIGAGFVRNLVWDRLHVYREPTPLNDLDLVYYDPADRSAERDRALEQQLQAVSSLPFSIKNQARMHQRSGRAPFTSCEDALSYWVELETAVAVSLSPTGALQLLAPFGLQSLFALELNHNPRHGDRTTFNRRVQGKGWCERWPKLTIKEGCSPVGWHR